MKAEVLMILEVDDGTRTDTIQETSKRDDVESQEGR